MQNLPMPNEYIFIDDEGVIVVASCYQTDTTGVVVVLRTAPLFYVVAEIDLTDRIKDFSGEWVKKFPNIIPAVSFYQEQTGCY